MKYLITGLALMLLLCSVSACEEDDPGKVQEDPLVVTITASAPTVSADAPVSLTITIENTGDTRLEWGSGSSACRLFARVVVDDQEYAVPWDEVCTADMVTYALEPGATDTQTKTWDGSIGRDGGSVDLPAGSYEVHGAGGKLTSAPVTLEVVR